MTEEQNNNTLSNYCMSVFYLISYTTPVIETWD